MINATENPVCIAHLEEIRVEVSTEIEVDLVDEEVGFDSQHLEVLVLGFGAILDLMKEIKEGALNKNQISSSTKTFSPYHVVTKTHELEFDELESICRNYRLDSDDGDHGSAWLSAVSW